MQGKGDWPVRRCGVYDGLRVVVSPVFPGAWAWETNEWYGKGEYFEGIQFRLSFCDFVESPTPIPFPLLLFVFFNSSLPFYLCY